VEHWDPLGDKRGFHCLIICFKSTTVNLLENILNKFCGEKKTRPTRTLSKLPDCVPDCESVTSRVVVLELVR